MLVTLDFETYYSAELSLRKMTTMDYVRNDHFKVWGVGIKIDHGETQWYGEDEVEAALEEIDWSEATLICHNTPFDGYILTRHYLITPAYYVDTAAMSRALYPGESASLKNCAERVFADDETMRKGDELVNAKGIYDLPDDIEAEIAGYCIQDVDLTYALYREFVTRMPLNELDIIDMTCRMFCEPKLLLDRDLLVELRDSAKKQAEETIEKSGYDRADYASNLKFAALIESLGITVPLKRSPTTGEMIPALGKNDPAFQQMCKMFHMHQPIWDARLAAKSRIDETRAQRFLDAAHDDGTISVPLKYYAAHTGRFGGTEKINMQNMPRDSKLRKALCAPPDHYLYVADLSNIEARVLAWLAGETDLLAQFANGEDIYSNFASTIFERPINKIDDPNERFVGKTAILGLGYGMGADTFKETLETGAMGPAMPINGRQAYEVVSKYRSNYPGIPGLWKALETKLAACINPVFSEDWRCLFFNDKKIGLPNRLSLVYRNLRYEKFGLVYDSRSSQRTWGGRITENVVQALARIVITDAMLRIERDRELHASVVLTVHDEIIALAPKNNADATMARLIEHMCTAPEWAPELPLDAEGGYDERYSK